MILNNTFPQRHAAVLYLLLSSLLLSVFPVTADDVTNFDDGEVVAIYPSHAYAPVTLLCGNSSFIRIDNFSYHYGNDQFSVSLTCVKSPPMRMDVQPSLSVNGACLDSYIAVGILSTENSNSVSINSSDDLRFLIQNNYMRLICRPIPAGYIASYYVAGSTSFPFISSSSASQTLCTDSAIHSITGTSTLCASLVEDTAHRAVSITILQTSTVTSTEPATTVTVSSTSTTSTTVTETDTTTVTSPTTVTETDTTTITSPTTVTETDTTTVTLPTTVTETDTTTVTLPTTVTETVTSIAVAADIPTNNVFANNTVLTMTVTVTAAQAAVSTMTATVTTTIAGRFASTVFVTNTATTTVTSTSTTIVTSTTTASSSNVEQQQNAVSHGEFVSAWKSAIVELVAISTSLLFVF